MSEDMDPASAASRLVGLYVDDPLSPLSRLSSAEPDIFGPGDGLGDLLVRRAEPSGGEPPRAPSPSPHLAFKRNLQLPPLHPGAPRSATADLGHLGHSGAGALNYIGGSAPRSGSDGLCMLGGTPCSPAEQLAACKIQAVWRDSRVVRRYSFCQYGSEATRLVKRYISGQAFDERAASKSHLILHFDINKTILISDKATGASQSDMVNVLLSECSWGRMTLGPQWIAVGRLATDRSTKDPQLMTYRNFLDSFLFPYVEGGSPQVQEENRRRKQLCYSRQRSFTDPGQPGEMFRGVYTALVNKITQPAHEAHKLFASGERRILPSFFELLQHLDRIGRTFTIVFRTFGSDITDVVEEMELFATGKHPSYPGVQLAGQHNTDLRVSIPEHTGAFFRTGPTKNDTILALGVTERVLGAKTVTRELIDEDVAENKGQVLNGFDDIHAFFCSFAPTTPERAGGAGVARKTCVNSAFAVRDYFPYWRLRNERPKAGKLILADPSDSNIVQIFFDDNIFHSSAHIVDARDAKTGETIPFSIAKNSHLVRVEPVDAILDPKYFVRAVNEAELTILRRAELKLPTSNLQPARGGKDVIFQGSAFRGLEDKRKSSVARTSLKAKQRWERALRDVLIMIRLTRSLMAGR